ncbi:DUF6122 family protein [uncultured Desulfobacter sp.]|uniref:DUF6122 family protein n=1 Tax=uncultured Desulfobacter sp. TaxID=240139 RepID=UPI002AAAEAE4|nr:DUF6122 family protein [uncultured Desulfobacter sp.]
MLYALQQIVHYSLHLAFPGVISWLFFKECWKKAWLIMLLTMLVDMDHLVADPMFDPTRCSIGFHPLHSYYAIFVYFLFFFFSRAKTIKIVSIGLLFHMFTDYQDCLWMKLTS